MSTFKVDTLQSTTGGDVTLTNQSAAKFFSNCQNNASQFIEFDSFNQSSTTDNGNGDHTCSLTNAFSTATFVSVCGTGGSSTQLDRNVTFMEDVKTASAIQIRGYDVTGAGAVGVNEMCVVGFGDLA